MSEAQRPSPHDTLLVHNPLKQPFTIEYEFRPWTIDAKTTVAHPRYLAIQFAKQMADAVINKMGDMVRDRITKAQPQISIPDLNQELLKREPRTNDVNLRRKIIKKIIVGVEKLYPMAKERPEDPKEGAVKAGVPYYSMDEEIIMEITNKDYARLAGVGVPEDIVETTGKITVDIDEFMGEDTPEPKKEEPVKPAKQIKEENDLFKEVLA